MGTPSTVNVVTDYGAKGDATADDTQAIQSAVDVFSNQQASGRVYFPTGVYRTTAPIVYRGLYSAAICLAGEVSSSGMSGAYLMYDGDATACAVLEFAGGVDCVVENLGLDTGPGGAQYGLYAHHDPTRTANGVGINHLTLDHVVVAGRGVRPGSACVSLGVDFAGVPDTRQCDDIQILSCKLVEAEKGIVIGSANVKNFFIERTAMWFSAIGVDFGIGGAGSGVCAVRNCNFLWNVVSDARIGVGIMNLESCQSEGSGALLINYGNSSNPANARIVGCNWDSKTLNDDVIIKFQGGLYIQGCQFSNLRTPESIPVVKLDWSDDQPSSLISEQNGYYGAADGYVNSKGESLFLNGSALPLFQMRPDAVRVFGDYGGVPGQIVHLRSIK